MATYIPQKAEDAASANGDLGVPILAVQKATPANTAGTDGDYEMLQMSAGRLWVSATIDAALPIGSNAIGKLAANDGVDIGDVTINNASLAVTVAALPLPSGAATELTLAAAAASLSVLDDWDETDRAKVNIIAGQAGITAGAGAVAVNTPRITLASDDPAVASLSTITGHVDGLETAIGTSADAASVTGSLHAKERAAAESLSVLDDWDELDRAKVNIIASQAGVDGGAGASSAKTVRVAIATNANTVDTELTTADLNTGAGTDTHACVGLYVASSTGATVVGAGASLPVGGGVSHDSPDSGSPIKIGGKARTTNPTAVTDADRADLFVDDLGRVVVVPNQARDLVSDTTATRTSSTAYADLIAADASNLIDILAIVLANTSSTGTEVTIANSDDTTVRMTFYVPANDVRGIVFGTPLKGSATNAAWRWKTVTSVASVKATVQFVKNGS